MGASFFDFRKKIIGNSCIVSIFLEIINSLCVQLLSNHSNEKRTPNRKRRKEGYVYIARRYGMMMMLVEQSDAVKATTRNTLVE